MKITEISSYPDPGCGVARYTYLLIQALRKAGHEVGAEPVNFTKSAAGLKRWKAVRKRISRDNPDWVHFQYTPSLMGPHFPGMIWYIRNIMRRKCVVTVHEKPEFFLKYLSASSGKVLLAAEKKALRSADKVIVHNIEHAALLRDEYKLEDSVINIPFPVYPAFENLPPADQLRSKYRLDANKTILLHGRITPKKGLDILLEALEKIADEYDFRLIIVGEHPPRWKKYYQEQREASDSPKLKGKVRWIGFLEDRDLGELLSVCDFAVLPYRFATNSGVLGTVLGYDLPVIASNTGGIGEILEESGAGFPVAPGDVNDLAETLAKALSDGTNLTDFRTNIREYRSKHNWTEVVQKMINEVFC